MKFKAIKMSSGGIAKLAFFTGATASGALVAAAQSQPGLRKNALKEGALHGAAIGSAPVWGPKAVKFVGRASKLMLKHGPVGKAARRATAYGKVVFRRIRGRLVPIRAKV